MKFFQLPNLDVHCLSGLASSPRSEQQSQLPHLLLRRGKVIIFACFFLYSAAAPIKLFLRFRVQFRRALSSCCTDSQTLDNRYFSKWCPYLEEIKLGQDCHRISRFDTTEMSKILEDVLVLQLMLTELTWVIWITWVKRMVGVTGVTVTGVTRKVGGDMGWHGFIPCNVTKCAK